MTTEEVIEIATYGKPSALAEHSKKDAATIAEIISVLQRKNISYLRASNLLKKCEAILEEIAKI